MARHPRIAVVGSANVDLTTFSNQFPKPGETIFGQKFDLGFGGKGANQAVAARLCGADVFMVARVGDDLFGPSTVQNFRNLGIDATHVRQVPGVSSGVAPIFVDPSGQNRIIVVKGANDELKPADVDAAAEMLKNADCIVLQFEIPLETVYYTIQFARRNGIRCILNPAPAQPIDIKAVADLDYFVPNESEAEAISGMPVRNLDDAKRCAGKLLACNLNPLLAIFCSDACISMDLLVQEGPARDKEKTPMEFLADYYLPMFEVIAVKVVRFRVCLIWSSSDGVC